MAKAFDWIQSKKDGTEYRKIQFLSDCVHELKNKTVDLPEVQI